MKNNQIKRLLFPCILCFSVVFSCSEEYLFALAKYKYHEKYTTIVYITNTGEKYHRAGCRYLSQSCSEIMLGDAVKAGYTACLVCEPPEFAINPVYE